MATAFKTLLKKRKEKSSKFDEDLSAEGSPAEEVKEEPSAF